MPLVVEVQESVPRVVAPRPRLSQPGICSRAAAAAAAAGPAAAAVATNARRAHLPLATPQRHLATCGRIGPFHELAETTD